MSSSPHVTAQHGRIPDDQTATTTMLAVAQHRYGGPGALAVERVPIPSPAGDEVLVRVHAASVNARDWHVMRGEPRIARLMAPGTFRLHRPRVAIRGTDLAGVVVAVGPDVTRWRPGNRVLGEGSGTFAEHAIASAGQLAAIPDGVPVEPAAALPLAATTALECLIAATPHAGQGLLINGASGGVGTFAIQIARALGLHVTAVASRRNADLARRLGAERVIDYATADFTATGEQHDILLDLVGNRSLDELRRAVRPGGALVLSGGGVPGRGRVIGPMRLLIGAQLQARSSDVRILTPQPAPSTQTLEGIVEMVRAGVVTPVIDRRFTLAQVPAALEYMERQHTQGKVIITVT